MMKAAPDVKPSLGESAGGATKIPMGQSYKLTMDAIFVCPFEAIRQYVENAKAVGSDWNARNLQITLEADTLYIQDDGCGCTIADLEKLVKPGSTKTIEEDSASIFSFFGTGAWPLQVTWRFKLLTLLFTICAFN
jgi:hypothetical protein